MAQMHLSTKHLQISKANARMVMMVAIAAFVTTFSLVAGQSLIKTRSYQAKVITEKEKAVKQLKDNKEAVKSLANSYKAFIEQPENIIKGNPTGTGERDGDNAKIVLDALPSKYDFPALTSSIEQMLAKQNYTIESITGTDDEVAQKGTDIANPEPIEIPFEFGVKTNFSSMGSMLGLLEQSIRPFEVTSLAFKGSDNEIILTVKAKTYYQPQKSLTITKKVVE